MGRTVPPTRGARQVKKSNAPRPPGYWMVSDEAIRIRAEELARQDPARTPEQNLQLAEAEYRAAAGGSPR